MPQSRVRAHESHTKTGRAYEVSESTRQTKGAAKRQLVDAMATKLAADAKAATGPGKAPAKTKDAAKGVKGSAASAVAKQAPKKAVDPTPAKRKKKASAKAAAVVGPKAKLIGKAPVKPKATTAAPKTTKAAVKGKAPAAVKKPAAAPVKGTHVNGRVVKHPKAAITVAKPSARLRAVGAKKPEVKHPLTGKTEPQLKTVAPAIDIHQPLTPLPESLGEGRTPNVAARMRRIAVIKQHLGKVAEKRHLEAKLFAAGPKEKGDIKQRLAAYAPYTHELVHRMHSKLMEDFDPTLRGIASDWMRKRGFTPRYDDHGRPEGNSYFADLAQQARMAAWRVITSHDPLVHKTSLEDQVRGSADQELTRKWRELVNGSGFRVSTRDNSALIKLSDVRAELSRQLNRDPNDEELAHAMDLESVEVKRLQKLAHDVVASHLDAGLGIDGPDGGSPITLADTIASPYDNPEEQTVKRDEHGRLKGLIHEAIARIQDPLARYAAVARFGIEDGGKAKRAVLRDMKVKQLAEGLTAAKAALVKAGKEHDALQSQIKATPKAERKGKEYQRLLDKAAKGKIPVTPDTIIKLALINEGMRAVKVNPNGQRYKLAQNLLTWKGDYEGLLSTPRMSPTKEDPENRRAAIAVSDLFERLGFSGGHARKMLMGAKRHLHEHTGLAHFASEDLEKGLVLNDVWSPEWRLYRFVHGDGAIDTMPTQIVKMWEADSGLMKSMCTAKNVWTVIDRSLNLCYQMAILPGPGAFAGYEMAKGIGTEMEQKHPGGRWVSIRGHHVYIDKGGTIQAGPHEAVGQPIAHLAEKLADAGHVVGEHTDAEGARTAATHHYVASNNGRTLHIHVRHEYAPGEKGADQHGVRQTIHQVTDEHGYPLTDAKGKKITSAQGIMEHLGVSDYEVQNGKKVKVASTNYNKELGKLIDKAGDSNDLSEGVTKLARGKAESRASIKASGGGVGTVKAKTAKAAAEKDLHFTEGEATSDGGKTFHAAMADGHAVEIHVGKDGRVRDQYWGTLLGHSVIQSADDLNAKLKAAAGHTSTIHLSNGDNHWLMRVRYDHKGTPVIQGGALDGKRLHEVLGETGGLKHYQGPVEHNGKQLFAGYDPKQGKTTALGNWSREKAHAYFEAHTPEEKAAVDAKLAAADAAAHPEVPTISMEGGENADERKARLKENKQRKKEGLTEREAPERQAVLSVPGDPHLVDLAQKMVEHGHVAPTGALNKKQMADLVEKAGDHPLLAGAAEHGLSDAHAEAIAKAHDIAKVLQSLQDEGHGKLTDLKGGKKGIILPVESIDRVASLIGGVKLKGDTMPLLQQARHQAGKAADAINSFDEMGTKVYGPEGHAAIAVPGMQSHLPNGARIGFTKHQQKLIHHYLNGGHRTVGALGVGNGKTSAALAAAELAKAQSTSAPKKHLVVVPSSAQVKAWRDDAKDFFGMQPYKPGDAEHNPHGKISFGKDIGPDADYHVVTRSMLANKGTRIGARALADHMAEHGYSRADLHDEAKRHEFAAKAGIKHDELLDKDGALVKHNKKVGGISLAQHLKEQGFDGVIVDEAHTLNHAGPKQGTQRKVVDAYIHGLDHAGMGLQSGVHEKAKGVMALTGTPVQNHPGEQFNLVQMTHRGQHDLGNEKQFLDTYMEKDPTTKHYTGIKDGKQGELGNKLARYMVTSTNEDLNEEKQPPSAKLDPLRVDINGEHHDAIAKAQGYGSAADMVKQHHDDLHSAGAGSVMEGEHVEGEKVNAKGALAAISRSEEELHAHKMAATEGKVREILRNDPHAKIILASRRVNGQNHLEALAQRVLGVKGDGTATGEGEYGSSDAVRAHMGRALDDVKGQMRDAESKHEALRSQLSADADRTRESFDRHHELTTRKARGESLAPAEEAELDTHAPAAKEHATLRDRLADFPDQSSTYTKLKQTHDDLVNKLGGSDGARLGYKYGVIRATREDEKLANQDALGAHGVDLADEDEADAAPAAKKGKPVSDAERQQAVKNFNNDESHKLLVVSSNIAASGVNLGRGTHIIDLDGDYNQANLEQLYGRHARLTGSVPEAVVHPVITEHSGAGGTTTLDQKKQGAVKRKAAVAGQIRQAARFGKVDGGGVEPPRVRAQSMGRKGKAPLGRTNGAAEPDLE